MNFDPKSLDRLKELGRQLPQELPKPLSKNISTPDVKKTLHPIETEEDPNQLFHELIKASKDGRVPPHLLNRLKELELSKELNKNKSIPHVLKTSLKKSTGSSNTSNFKLDDQQDDLYTLFTQLLLEEEI